MRPLGISESNLVREFDELSDDKLEELSHAELSDALTGCPIVAGITAPGRAISSENALYQNHRSGCNYSAAFQPARSLRASRLHEPCSSSTGCAPYPFVVRADPMLARSIFRVLFSPGTLGS
jgi:hypothetical protein